MLNQRRRRWADVVQMLYKCFVFAWNLTSHMFTQSMKCGPNAVLILTWHRRRWTSVKTTVGQQLPYFPV